MSSRIDWLGAQPQDVVIANLTSADLFFLPSRMARDGDRDGLPNVLMEAQIMGLPVAATRMAAIPELVVEDETGVLVDPGDAPALAEALVSLARDPAARARLAAAGRTRVRSHFSAEAGLDHLAELLKAQPELLGHGPNTPPQHSNSHVTNSDPEDHADRLLRASETTDSPDALG